MTDFKTDTAVSTPGLAERIREFFQGGPIRGQMLGGDLSPQALTKPVAALAAVALLAGALGAGAPQGAHASDQARLRVTSSVPAVQIDGRIGLVKDHEVGVVARVDAQDLSRPQVTMMAADPAAGDPALRAISGERGTPRQVEATRTGAQVQSHFYHDSGFFHTADIERTIRYDSQEVCYRGKARALGRSYDMTACTDFADVPASGRQYLDSIARQAGITPRPAPRPGR